jgi:hypothetical protein
VRIVFLRGHQGVCFEVCATSIQSSQRAWSRWRDGGGMRGISRAFDAMSAAENPSSSRSENNWTGTGPPSLVAGTKGVIARRSARRSSLAHGVKLLQVQPQRRRRPHFIELDKTSICGSRGIRSKWHGGFEADKDSIYFICLMRLLRV